MLLMLLPLLLRYARRRCRLMITPLRHAARLILRHVTIDMARREQWKKASHAAAAYFRCRR